ncbi:MAG: protein kinase, partial [Anaerolineae bacterium]
MSPYLVGERYQLIDRVGSGGAGIVHTALDLHTGDRVAIKELHEEHRSDPVLLARFRQEAQLLRDLNHPNIVKMLELIADERFYIDMEYVEGGTLADLIGRQAPMPVEQAVGIALELADALARAHHLNVIHRDVKPANVLMAYGNVPRLTDFGIAHLMDITAQGGSDTLQGTFKYMSPESFHSVKPGVYTDSWSFGVVLYEMLTGSTPYQATSPGELVSAILTQPIPPVTASRPDLPEELARLLAGLLERDHTRRVASMRQIAARLESIQKGHVTDSTADLDVRGKPTQSIPTPRTSFIGRTRELAEIADQLADPGCRLLTLIGPGGMGKTRLALQTAIDHADAYPDGVYFVPLAPVERPAFIAAAVAEALPYVFVGGGDVEGQVIDFLREKTVLLVLDNAEHLVDDMHFPAAMLEAAPRLTILATSRRRLDISGEWLYPVRGLHYPQHPHDPDVTGFSAV